MELEDKHVVVTGAASGIGRACAAAFAAAGARVVVADLSGQAAEQAATEIGGLAVATDVRHEAEIQALIQAAQERNGPIDLFFSNAGVPGPPGGPEAPDDEIQAAWEVNVLAHLWAARALLPGMVQRGDGYLLSTASAAGLLTQVSALAYSITKHSAVALAEWISINYGDAGIKVSCLCPQAVRTPMLDLALEDPVGAVPLLAGGTMEPEAVAEAVVNGVREEQFLILPHSDVAHHLALKGSQPERWLKGMRRVVRQARAQAQTS